MNNSLFFIERAWAEDAAAHLPVSLQSFRGCLLCTAFHKIFQQALTSNRSVTIIGVTERLLI